MKQVILTTLLFSALSLSAEDRKAETRTATMTVPIGKNERLTLNVKNTALRLEAWDKNEVSIEATVKMSSSVTESRAEFLDNWQSIVESGVSSSSFGVRVSSALEATKEVNKRTFLGMVVSTSITTDKAYDITYKIKAPAGSPLKIDGSYKDVLLVGDFEELELSLYSANFQADNLIDAELGLKYGNATIQTIKEADITLYENGLEVEQIGFLDLGVKYSEVEIERLGSLKLDSYE